MGRYTESVCRLCRREGIRLYLKGDRCYSDKCAIERRSYPPGEHGQSRRSKVSPYGQQLREKQKARRIYGVMERQFRNYFKKASKKQGVTGEILLQLLETRLDNLVYRLGIAPSRNAARQLVKHGHVVVNGRRADIPSYHVRPGDTISVRENSKKLDYIKEAVANRRRTEMQGWLSFDEKDMSGVLLQIPSREDIPVPVQEQLIVELYSK
ncbi:MAG: 30S ribosomal protein S4 [Candidatus Eisenbacteria bacterium]|uniref:Small ribosomal subunit protein uS4 n=1 Tax=Eiseniibacteriota bacterium TaxID=2212470 RepID=A0A956NDS2_UNCEI|nr:30S ribosomal protein S4 [Candidatus Eisenbacteria bacterium]MCB9463605.1 30S ribosomal protein S4 [Candidatus Eisenbacteria bacterium]